MWWLPFAHANTFMPPAATEIAGQVDNIYAFLLISSFVSFVLLIGGMIYFVWKYRRRSPNDKTAYITHNHTLEFLWSFIPFVIFMFVFAWGWIVYHQMRSFPEGALEVHVVGKKWDWRFIYKNGKEVTSGVDDKGMKAPATMVVPVGRPVKLIMSSEQIAPGNKDPKDRPVLHSFYVPAFRIKQDLVPGRYTAQWFKADKLGEFNVFCTEYCGSGHSAMRAMIRVVPVEEFESWLASEGGGVMTLADQGRQLFGSKACVGCHSLDGTRVVGPTFKGLFGSEHAIEGGSQVKVDEDYLRESILNPAAKIAAGYPAGVMPTYAGQLSDDELKALVEYIKTVK
jgi:cytochrome c oxidase subunit 2